MAELVDAGDLKSPDLYGRLGSNPSPGTLKLKELCATEEFGSQPKTNAIIRPGSPLNGICGVDPVSWTVHPLTDSGGRNSSGSNNQPPLMTRQMVWVLRMSSSGFLSSNTMSASLPGSSVPR